MATYEERLAALGARVPEVFLPAEGVDYSKWAVVACDQYSSEREYWKRAQEAASGAPSTLNLIFPEAFLEDADKGERIARIQSSMTSYLSRGVLRDVGAGMVLVERFTSELGAPRVGLVMAFDLEAYDYSPGSASLIRPSEGTIVERLPPRVAIRRGAVLELPHIMILVDDPGRTVIEPIYASREGLPRLYDFELMLGSGRARGWKVSDTFALERLAGALERLADPAAFRARHGRDEVMLFAVGDGNHSLATAKAVWEETKKTRAGDSGLMEHPARWALAELVNLYDEGLPFHPIHRLLTGASCDRVSARDKLAAAMKAGAPCEIESAASVEAAVARVDEADPERAHRVAMIDASGASVVRFPRPAAKLAAGTMQAILDPFIKSEKGAGIDYIHGTESLVSLARKSGNVGFYLPPIDKSGFFETVVRDGAMPRKTFSMGEAPDKRFYIEARKIVR
jgi:hypothetical protein